MIQNNTDCIFCRIINKEIPAKAIYEDDLMIAFYDIKPKAKVHVLLVPKKHIKSLADTTPEDKEIIGQLLGRVRSLAEKLGIAEGFNIVINNGVQAGQAIPHLHLHILSGWKYRDEL